MTRRKTRWTRIAGYLATLVAPVLLLGVGARAELSTWLATGMCPAGPMDRPSAACDLGELAFIVLLGGWASFVVVPLLALWALGCTALWLGIARTR